MDWFKNVPMAAYSIGVGIIVAIAWVTVGGTIALVITIAGGGSIAMKGALGGDDEENVGPETHGDKDQ